MNGVIDIARAKLERMKRNDYPYPDDDILIIPRGGNPGAGPGASAALFVAEPDIAAVNATAPPERPLRNDGTIAQEMIKSAFVAHPQLPPHQLPFRPRTQ